MSQRSSKDGTGETAIMALLTLAALASQRSSKDGTGETDRFRRSIQEALSQRSSKDGTGETDLLSYNNVSGHVSAVFERRNG